MNDWMHYTARCLGNPSDSNRTARKRVRAAASGPPSQLYLRGTVQLRQRASTSPPPPVWPPRAACSAARLGQSGPGWPGSTPTVTGPAPSCGRWCRPLRASPAWAGRVISSSTGPAPLVRQAVLYSSPLPGRHPRRPLGIAGPVSLAYHSAASVGQECCVHCIASGWRLRRSRGYRAGRNILYRKLPRFTTKLPNCTTLLPNSKFELECSMSAPVRSSVHRNGTYPTLKTFLRFFIYRSFEGVEAPEGCKNVA